MEPDETAELDTGAGRLARLERAVEGLRGRGNFDVERAMLAAGSVLVLLGLGMILLGWWGASHTPFLFEQVPYLISGGMFGLGIAFLGGFCYFAFWVTKLIGQSRDQARIWADGLDRIEELLRSGAGPAPRATKVSGPGHPARGSSAGNGVFVATERGTMFHRPDCTVVAGRTGLRRVGADASGMEPCRLCDPLGD